jgi:uncharacterized protein (DUF433 family)
VAQLPITRHLICVNWYLSCEKDSDIIEISYLSIAPVSQTGKLRIDSPPNIMMIDTLQTVPLTLTQDGTIRVSGSRVSLDSIIYQYLQGGSAEQIHESFPSLNLADIYAVISYYLNHRDTIDGYLRQQEAKAEALRHRIECDPSYQAKTSEIRERVQQRWQARQSD